MNQEIAIRSFGNAWQDNVFVQTQIESQTFEPSRQKVAKRIRRLPERFGANQAVGVYSSRFQTWIIRSLA
jgi:hypothetical protein